MLTKGREKNMSQKFVFVRVYKMKERCSYADKYKAIRKPTCGCKVCNKKWQDALASHPTPVWTTRRDVKVRGAGNLGDF